MACHLSDSALERIARTLGSQCRAGRAPQVSARGAVLLLVGVVPVFVRRGGVNRFRPVRRHGVQSAVRFALAIAVSFSTTVATVAVVYRFLSRSPTGHSLRRRGCRGKQSLCGSAAYVAHLRVGANFERRYASDALAAVVPLGVRVLAANTALLVGYLVTRERGVRR